MGDLDDKFEARVERALARCMSWSQEGRHRRVLHQVELLLPLTRHDPHLKATLLIWKAQALLTMGFAERALQAARTAWQLESSPHACHVQASALTSLGEADAAEELLNFGSSVFPHSLHLPLQLAMLLTDQGRFPEALTVLEDIPIADDAEEDLYAFVVAMRADLLAATGKWSEAQALLADELVHEPDSELLQDAQESISAAYERLTAERRLVAIWSDGLGELSHSSREVDDAIRHLGMVTELSQLTVLAARRLWRAFLAYSGMNVLAPDPWAVAALLSVVSLDGDMSSVASWARATATSAHTVRANLRRIRTFLGELDPEFARRSFAAHSNPMLDSWPSSPAPSTLDNAEIIPFPDSRRSP